ncbi:hypothetical protein AKJ18_13880 [Vibrio xuii]|nr:hypothetical protein AKJ18_13880 [Vibrio xuii]
MAQISIPRVSDYQLLKIFIDEMLLKLDDSAFNNQSPQVTIRIHGNVFTIYIDSLDKDEVVAALRKDRGLTTRISQISFAAPSIHPQCSFTYNRSQDSFIDRIIVPDQQLNAPAIELLGRLNKLLLKHADKAFGNKGDSSLELSTAHHDILSGLEGLNADLIAKQHDFIQKLEEEKQQFLNDRSEEYAAKVDDLNEAHAIKLNDLEELYTKRSLDLDERQKLIDDADNTTARRKTTTKTLEDAQKLAKRFSFSQNVSFRTAISAFFALLLVIIGGANALYALNELNALHSSFSKYILTAADVLNPNQSISQELSTLNNQQINFLYVRLFFGSTLMVSSIVYLIRWNNSWASRIAQQELDNQSFVRDLNRAQMAVEMSLEWNEKKDGSIPEKLLEALTEGLFKSSEPNQSEILHPAEQVAAAMLKASDKISVPFGNANLEMSGKKFANMKPKKSEVANGD